jgi:hypothetical protein
MRARLSVATMPLVGVLSLIVLAPAKTSAQYAPGEQGSDNVEIVAHVPLAGALAVADIEIEQDLDRPYAYVSRRLNPAGFQVIDLSVPDDAKLIYSWFIENAELHRGDALDGKYFKLDGRYYYVQSMSFRQGGPDNDLGAVVFDVTGLPDPTTVREVGRIRAPDTPGGFHNIYAYKHSTGRVLLFATTESPLSVPHGANVYDMELFLQGDADYGLVSRIPLPEPRGAARGYHDAFVGYDAATGQDKFYGGGPETTYLGGNYVWDVTDITNPELLVTQMAVMGQQSGGHTWVPTPDHRYAVSEMTSLAHAPLRFFDLKPALDGEVAVIRQPIGEWTADWKKSSHNMEIRWPYMFVSAYEDGLQIVNIRNPTNPRTVGFYDTYDEETAYTGGGVANGVFGVDVRNADGLIVVSDMHSGFWAFRMDGFTGWNGNDWGMPNVSSVQDWDNGPEGVRNIAFQ